MPIKVPYSLLPGDKTRVLMPVVPVTFINKEHEFSTFALVDSGATGATISTVVADALKIDWSQILPKKGLTTSGTFIFHPVKVVASIYGHKFSLIVSVIEGISPFKCILGEADIFQRAQITFRRYKYEFEILFREYN